MTPVHHSLSMKSGSTPMKVIHISAIFTQARVYSRSLKVQHVCWTLPFKIARQMFRSFCEPLRLHWRSCIKLIWMTNTTRMKTFYDAHAWVKMIRPICIRSFSHYRSQTVNCIHTVDLQWIKAHYDLRQVYLKRSEAPIHTCCVQRSRSGTVLSC